MTIFLVFRLTIIATIISGCFVASIFFYAMIYYLVIPVSIQEAPLHFKLQKAPEVIP